MDPIKSLFLIEDNPDDIDLALKAFQPFNNIRRIETARDGEEALRLMDSWQDENSLPSLILLDLNLPKVDGFDLLRFIKSDPRYINIPVIILTTSTEETDIRKAYQLGTNSYLNKPVNFSDFQNIAAMIHHYWNGLNVTTI